MLKQHMPVRQVKAACTPAQPNSVTAFHTPRSVTAFHTLKDACCACDLTAYAS